MVSHAQEPHIYRTTHHPEEASSSQGRRGTGSTKGITFHEKRKRRDLGSWSVAEPASARRIDHMKCARIGKNTVLYRQSERRESTRNKTRLLYLTSRSTASVFSRGSSDSKSCVCVCARARTFAHLSWPVFVSSCSRKCVRVTDWSGHFLLKIVYEFLCVSEWVKSMRAILLHTAQHSIHEIVYLCASVCVRVWVWESTRASATHWTVWSPLEIVHARVRVCACQCAWLTGWQVHMPIEIACMRECVRATD